MGEGLVMVTLDELRAQLGDWVNDDALRKWSKRHGLTRVKLDGQWWYGLEAAIEIEYRTASSGRGRPRGTRRQR